MNRALVLASVTAAAVSALAGGKLTMEQYRGELSLAMQREKDAKEALSQEQVRVEDLRLQNEEVLGRISATRMALFGALGISDNDVVSFEQRLSDCRFRLNTILQLPGAELLQSRTRFEEAKNQLASLRAEPTGRLPRFGPGLREAEELIPQYEQRWVAETEAAKQAQIQEALAAKEAAKAAKQAAKEAALAAKAEARAAKERARLEQRAAAEQARADRRAAKLAAKSPRVSQAGADGSGIDLTNAESYTVEPFGKSGDCLWNIAKRIYGDVGKWEVLYDANRDVVKDPDFVKAGTTLRIPR